MSFYCFCQGNKCYEVKGLLPGYNGSYFDYYRAFRACAPHYLAVNVTQGATNYAYVRIGTLVCFLCSESAFSYFSQVNQFSMFNYLSVQQYYQTCLLELLIQTIKPLRGRVQCTTTSKINLQKSKLQKTKRTAVLLTNFQGCIHAVIGAHKNMKWVWRATENGTSWSYPIYWTKNSPYYGGVCGK